MVFHLCSLGGRVVLSLEPMGVMLEAIDAEPEMFDGEIYRSAWRVARDQVPEDRFWHCPGWGWFEMWAGPCGINLYGL